MKSAFVLIVVMVMVKEMRAQFNPTVIFTCALGPEYTFAVTNAVVGGKIYIDGECDFQNVTAINQIFTFTAGECLVGSVPPIGTEFDVRLQKLANIETETDKLVRSRCNMDLTAFSGTVSVSAVSATNTADDTPTDTITPTVTMAVVESASDTVLTSGTVGDVVRIKISLASGEQDVFGFKVANLSSSNMNLVTAGCTAIATIVAQPGLPALGVLYVNFTLFRPVSSATVAPSPLTLTVELDVCNGSCSAASCNRRRRSDDESGFVSGSSTIKTVTASTSILVYPPGLGPQNNIAAESKIAADLDGSVCIARAPMLGLLIGLCTALVVCMCVSTWLFCKLRHSRVSFNVKGLLRTVDSSSNNKT